MLNLSLWLFVGFALINLFFYAFFAGFLWRRKLIKPSGKTLTQPLSVIVCAKNEAQNLEKNIPHILSQDYPNFELILVNDSSKDNTLEVMEEFEKADSRVKIVNVLPNEHFWGNKKYALTLGIKKAKNDFLVFTDADCHPESNLWLQYLATAFNSQKQLVLGYGKYKTQKGLLNKFIRFETLLTAIQYFAYAHYKSAYMGVGRNLAYTSKLFYEHNGFVNHMNILSGDDDLFVNESANRKNTAYCTNKNSFTLSDPENNWQDWMFQKKRHISTAKHYKGRHKFFLGLFYTSQLGMGLFFLLTNILLIFKFEADVLQLLWIVMLLRYLVVLLVFAKATRVFKEKRLLRLFPLLEWGLVTIQMLIFVSNQNKKPTTWAR